MIFLGIFDFQIRFWHHSLRKISFSCSQYCRIVVRCDVMSLFKRTRVDSTLVVIIDSLPDLSTHDSVYLSFNLPFFLDLSSFQLLLLSLIKLVRLPLILRAFCSNSLLFKQLLRLDSILPFLITFYDHLVVWTLKLKLGLTLNLGLTLFTSKLCIFELLSWCQLIFGTLNSFSLGFKP